MLDATGQPLGPTPSSQSPRVAFPSAYVLTRAQEDDLVDHIFERKTTLEIELGRDVIQKGGRDWFTGLSPAADLMDNLQFLPRRELFDLVYLNKMAWRRYCLGGIFRESNLTLPLSRRVVRQMIARANTYFVGADPWFGTYAASAVQQKLSEDIDRFAKYKVAGSGLVKTIRSAIKWAFVRGEGIVKTTFEQKEQVYRTNARVLVDVRNEPILDARGDYIFEQDAWMPEVAPDPVTGQTLPTGKSILRKDGVTAMPDAPLFLQKRVTRVLPIYRGPRSEVVYFKDFLCPLQASSVHQADIVIQLYDAPVMQFADLMQRGDALGGGQSAEEMMQSQEGAASDIRAAVAAIRDMSGGGDQPKSARDQPRAELGEQLSGNTSGSRNPTIEIAECYLNYDADGDGIAEEIVVFIDVRNRRPLFYDYLANVFNNARRPFEVLRVHEVDGRWYGLGAIEMFEPLQTDIDLLINRANFSQSSSGRVTIWRPHLTREGQKNPHLRLNMGGTYTPANESVKNEEILSYITLPDVKTEDLMRRIEYNVQFVTTESGTANANDGAMAGLDSQKLATGIMNIDKSGQELFTEFLDELEAEVQQVLTNEVSLVFSRMDPVEVYDFFDGQQSGRQVAELSADDVRHLAMKATLKLTRTQAQQEVASGQTFVPLLPVFNQFTPEQQARFAPVFTWIAKALKIPNADQMFAPMNTQSPTPGVTGAALPSNVIPGPGQPPGAPTPSNPPHPELAAAGATPKP